jgi:hypothetical protein
MELVLRDKVPEQEGDLDAAEEEVEWADKD